MKSLTNSGFFKFPLGKLELFVFTDGFSAIDPIQPMFAPNIEASEVKKFLEEHFLSSEELTLSGNVLLVKACQNIVLIDTGCGKKLGPTCGKLLENLESAGISSGDITDIVITHAHPDHIGGIVHADDNLAFPNAKIHISKTEYDFWTAEKPDFSKGTHDATADFEIQFARHHLSVIHHSINFYDDHAELWDFMKLDKAPGHTPGHYIVTIASEGDELVHIADTFQHLLLVAHPEWGNQIDTDFELAIKTRREILEKLASGRQLFFGDHLPFPGLGFIRKQQQSYQYMPKAFYTV